MYKCVHGHILVVLDRREDKDCDVGGFELAHRQVNIYKSKELI